MFLPPLITLHTRSELTGNATTSSWVLEPDGRGTFGILRSCVLTLVLCVNTAIHLYIPAAEDTKTAIWLRKAKWVTVAMFAPELVVYVAWCQRQQVVQLQNHIRRHMDKDLKKAGMKGGRKHAWTLRHSWYAKMGGFAIDTGNDTESNPYILGSPRITVDDDWLYTLARKGWLPDLPRSYIDDKSKADGVAKTLVIVQSSWMILQCAMRWASGLTVTSLELNTLAHAVCALLIYALWWQKPLDIAHPTILTGEWTATLASLIWMRRNFEYKSPSIVTPWRYKRSSSRIQRLAELMGPESYHMVWYDLDSLNIPLEWRGSGVGDVIRIFNTASQQYTERRFNLRLPSTKQPELPVSRNEVVLLGAVGVGLRDRTYGESLETITLGKDCLERFKLVWDTRNKWGNLSGFADMNRLESNFIQEPWDGPRDDVNQGYGTYCLDFRELSYHSAQRVLNWIPYTVDGRSERSSTVISLTAFLACGLAYGGIHAAAWNNRYSTVLERSLWRASCLCVTSYSIVVGIPVLCLLAIESVYWTNFLESNIQSHEQWEAEVSSRLLPRATTFRKSFLPDYRHHRPWLFWPGAFLLGSATLLYLAARTFLVIEGFISLRDAPLSAYQTSEWTRYLPHL